MSWLNRIRATVWWLMKRLFWKMFVVHIKWLKITLFGKVRKSNGGRWCSYQSSYNAYRIDYPWGRSGSCQNDIVIFIIIRCQHHVRLPFIVLDRLAVPPIRAKMCVLRDLLISARDNKRAFAFILIYTWVYS